MIIKISKDDNLGQRLDVQLHMRSYEQLRDQLDEQLNRASYMQLYGPFCCQLFEQLRGRLEMQLRRSYED